MTNQLRLKIYNTLSREKDVFRPIDPQNVRIYVCGPTVYDFAHIGNARPVIVFDVLHRLLRRLYPGGGKAADGSRVTYVRNITDVEDKITARAQRDYPELPINEAIRKVTETTANRFHEDVAALGCHEPTHEPRATEHIDGMVEMIQALVNKGHAYVAKGGEGREVLFDTASMPEYGALSRRKLEDQQAGARVAVEAHKKNAADFVLWKESSAKEPGWDGAFTVAGKTETIHGRPGWHIECSVMSNELLWETVKDRLSPEARKLPHRFDIHGGGLDLIFPHHENEIAQSRCAHGSERMANYWMHNGYLQIEGRKMAKSEGNFVTIHDLLHTRKFGGRKWPGAVLRLAMLMTHYREPIDFNVRRLEEAESLLRNWADRKIKINQILGEKEANLELVELEGSPILDDLNLHPVISELSGLGRAGADGDIGLAASFIGLLDILGLRDIDEFSQKAANLALTQDGHAHISRAIETRLAFIRDKNWAEADRIRDELAAQGIRLMDDKNPETGERVTIWEVKR